MTDCEHAHRAFPKCITVSVECGCYPSSLHILSRSRCISAPVCLPCLFPSLLQRILHFQVTACLLCSLCPRATSSECHGRGLLAAALHVTRWAWGAKAGCVLTETWALPRGDGFHHDKELNSHGNSSLLSADFVILLSSLLFCSLFSQVSYLLLVYFNLVLANRSYPG